ncbi:thioesterase family protein [Hymenobacter sp. BT491]|uniref:thioesterase family protein n=1 Tax=Hymenobacter sp. BT491 TaxID=2766779 RepID=UPI001653A2A0|nr:hypothetical protein [Hymenobacter sp. BT491]MBC6990421.1 hypothetical protein [Hymenobacter sp. BT491]
MKNPFQSGAVKTYTHVVTPADFAVLDGRTIHELYSTFALGRDMEWTSRQFVEEMLEAGEAGIGTMVHIDHIAPAFEGETVAFCATFEALEGRELTCTLEARVGPRLVATGRTGQRITSEEKLTGRFAALRSVDVPVDK